MMSPKAYLFSIGAIKEIGRGRLSKENIEKCKAGAAKGVQIEGYTVSKATADEGQSSETVVTKTTPINTASVIAEPFYRYGENGVETHEAVTADGRVFNLRQACHCGYSLSGHICEDPAILTDKMVGHERVTIRPKKTVA
jgi:hypothetical protein